MEKTEENICVGLHETLRAVSEGKLQKIILADDTDATFRAKVKHAAEKNKIPLECVPSSAELGKNTGIEVKAGVVGVFKS